MKLILQFDIDADIVDVPENVIEERNILRKKFLCWIYRRNNKHKYWVTNSNSCRHQYIGVRFRGDAFVEWLNTKFLDGCDEKATVLESHVSDPPPNIPVLFF